ncbi:MAG TPA: tRNA lysidine(34) synthetase TilS [Actinomycetota bacterium]
MAGRPPAVARVLERATRTIRRHEMLPPGRAVLVACSGGPDSICLLHALHRLRRLFRIRLEVFHFDHRLRRTSSEHAAYVRGQARRLGLPFHLRAADGGPARGESPEAWARLARYAALTEVATERGIERAAVAHTRDDQAETVLLGLVRGGGLEAVAGMDPVATVPPLALTVVRPLLEVTRDEIVAFCRSLRLRPREDPTNRDPRFLRNRVRHRVLPHLERELGRNLRATLARVAANVREDAAYLDQVASAAAREVVEVDEGEVRMRVARLRALVPAVGSRVARDALRVAAAMAGSWTADVEAAHVEAILDLARGRPGRRIDLPGALMGWRDREYVRLRPAGEAT